MKLIICTTSVLFFLGAYATPVAEDDARLKIKSSFAVAEAIVEEVFKDLDKTHSDHWLLAVKPFVKSIDQECVFEKYKKLDMFDQLMTEEEIIPKITEMMADPAKDKRLTRLAAIGVTCSSKINPVLSFIFNILAAVAELVVAFRDVLPLNEYFDQLNCYAHYTIFHDIIDPIHQSSFKPAALVNQTEEECYQTIEQYMFMITAMMNSEQLPDPIEAAHRECVGNELLEYVKKVLFMVNVLLQAEVPENEKALARKLFLKNFHSTFEKILLCEPSTKAKFSE